MNVVTHVDFADKGSWDSLDGRRIENGERLRIFWPDGTVWIDAVKVARYSKTFNDEPTPYHVVDQAFVDTTFRGVPISIPLAGLHAERV